MTREYRSFYYDDLGNEPISDDFIVPVGTEMTPELLRNLIQEHEETRLPRYMRLKAAYETKYLIFDQTAKPDYKPDNRLAADFAKYIQDTFEGYYIGVPPEVRVADTAQNEWLRDYMKRNNQEDVDADLSDYASEFGKSVELLYQDENGLPASVALTPMSAFCVYDDSVLRRKLFGIRYAHDEEGLLQGTYSDDQYVYHFQDGTAGLVIDAGEPHAFGEVPMIEYSQNKDQRGIFEGVLNLIEAYNKALSEKANDVDYFGDAYMVIEGYKIEEEEFKKDLKSYRLINPYNNGGDDSKVGVYFLTKPDADSTQEHLINRLEELIYKLSMVPDISDQSFGTASGIALRMRLLPMSNLARKKDRKFTAAIRERFRLLANYPNQPFTDWEDVEIVWKRNEVTDLSSEAALAASLSGVVSQETQLSVLSCVDDPIAEIERMNEEREQKASEFTMARRATSTYEKTSILAQRRRGEITYNVALQMLMETGYTDEQARRLLDDRDEE